METITKRVLIDGWATTPIPHFTLSAAGLVALADLSTIAQRTALAGGSSWLDSLLLAPGLHYQQAADALAKEGGLVLNAVETERDGRMLTYSILNQATINYIERIARPGEIVTLDVGQIPPPYRRRRKRASLGQRGTVWAGNDTPDLGWLSHLLYLTSPILTVVAFTFMIMLEDWWGLGFLSALMVSRLLNIWVIKQRSTPPKKHKEDNHDHGRHNQLTEYLVDLGHGRTVCLRGMSDDLQAITATAWLRNKTFVEGYLEAMAKVLVYLVAAFSGNSTQAGSIIMMSLLLVTAGLLALSNAHAKSLRNNGRVVSPSTPAPGSRQGGTRDDPPYPPGDHSTTSWPGSSGASGMTGMDDWAEKGQIGNVVGHHGPFDGGVDYR